MFAVTVLPSVPQHFVITFRNQNYTWNFQSEVIGQFVVDIGNVCLCANISTSSWRLSSQNIGLMI